MILRFSSTQIWNYKLGNSDPEGSRRHVALRGNPQWIFQWVERKLLNLQIEGLRTFLDDAQKIIVNFIQWINFDVLIEPLRSINHFVWELKTIFILGSFLFWKFSSAATLWSCCRVSGLFWLFGKWFVKEASQLSNSFFFGYEWYHFASFV